MNGPERKTVISLTANKLRALFDEGINDICFEYNGISYGVFPINRGEFDVGIGNDVAKHYETLDDLMKDPICNGKTLEEIAGQITIL